MNIERVFVGIAVFLLLPYILLSTLLHTYGPTSPNGLSGPSTVPPDHHWRLAGNAKHGGPNPRWSGFPPRGASVSKTDSQSRSHSFPVDPSGILALAPGTAAVLAWIDMQRRAFPERFQLPSFHSSNYTGTSGAAPLVSHPIEPSSQAAQSATSSTWFGAHSTNTKASLYQESEQLLPSLGAISTRSGSSFVPPPRDIHGATVAQTSTDPVALSRAKGVGVAPAAELATQRAPLLPPPSVQSSSPSSITRSVTTSSLRLSPTNSSHMGSRSSSVGSGSSSSSSRGKDQTVAVSTKDIVTPKKQQRLQRARCLLFTMDSIDGYVARAAKGGASGEITIRESLVSRLATTLGVDTDVARSDKEFERLAVNLSKGSYYAFVVLDAWTWAAKGWVPKRPLIGHEHQIFLLDFFGAKGPNRNGINVPPNRILTAFPTYPGNTFLGYAISPQRLTDAKAAATAAGKKKPQGVIWGKDPKHFVGRTAWLKAAASVAGVTLHSTLSTRDAPASLRNLPNIVFHGHLTRPAWQKLLAESSFMIGLGNPLVGPSAVDAVVAGCVYINPIYDQPMKEMYWSQHPFLEKEVGAPHVCSAKLSDLDGVAACASAAIAAPVAPMIPKELTEDAYDERLENIFGPMIPLS